MKHGNMKHELMDMKTSKHEAGMKSMKHEAYGNMKHDMKHEAISMKHGNMETHET
jgi:hypothetical protein